MLESSKDLLNVVIAFSILWFTVFLCWGMYYFISILRNANRVTTSIRQKLEVVDNILVLVKDKLEKGSNTAAVITDSVIKLTGLIIEKQKKSSSAAKKKTARKAAKKK